MKYKIIYNATEFQNIYVLIFLKINTELGLRDKQVDSVKNVPIGIYALLLYHVQKFNSVKYDTISQSIN